MDGPYEGTSERTIAAKGSGWRAQNQDQDPFFQVAQRHLHALADGCCSKSCSVHSVCLHMSSLGPVALPPATHATASDILAASR
jgi:hypothetical protein